MRSEITEKSGYKFSVTGPDVPAARYVITGGVTSFVAEIATLGITFGYKPQGDVGQGGLTGGEGKVKVRIGQLEMDFQIVDTQTGVVVVAKHASANDFGIDLEAEVDFNSSDWGPLNARFIYDSPLTPFFRKVLGRVISKMAEDPHTNFMMDWQTQVTRLNLSKKKLSIGTGMRGGIVTNNVLSVYDREANHIGEIKVESADMESSTAAFKDDDDGRKLQASQIGDDVKIFFKEIPN